MTMDDATDMASDQNPSARLHPSDRALRTSSLLWLRKSLRNRDLAIGVALTGILLVVLAFPGLFTPYAPNAVDPSHALAAPSLAHPFGTDQIGRDVYTRVLWGSRITLGMVTLALTIPAVVGFVLGLLAGFYGGWLDSLLGRLIDILLSFPSMIMAVIITGILGPGIKNGVLALAIIYMPMFFRVARSATMAEANLTYVEAARSLGVGELSTAFRHVSRNIVHQIVVQFTVLFPAAIQISAALGYLGLGVQPPVPDWGAILNQGKNNLFNAPWVSAFPGLAIIFAAIALTMLGRGLRKALETRRR